MRTNLCGRPQGWIRHSVSLDSSVIFMKYNLSGVNCMVTGTLRVGGEILIYSETCPFYDGSGSEPQPGCLGSGSPCCRVQASPPTPPPWPLYPWAHWATTGVAGERSWVVSTQPVILSAWLLKSFSTKATLESIYIALNALLLLIYYFTRSNQS